MQYFEQDSWPQARIRKYGNYRLMRVSRTGKISRVTTGSIKYLLKLRKKRNNRWIELSTQPARLK